MSQENPFNPSEGGPQAEGGGEATESHADALLDQAFKSAAGADDAPAPPKAATEAAPPQPPPAPQVDPAELDKFARERAAMRKQQEEFTASQRQFEEQRQRFEQAQKMFFTDPVGAMMEMGADEDTMRRTLERLNWHAMGDDALPEYKASNEVARLKRELAMQQETLKQEIEGIKRQYAEEQKKAEMQRTTAEWTNNVSAALSSEDIDNKYPNLSTYLEASGKDQSVQAVLAVVGQMQQQNQSLPSLDEAMAEAEKLAGSNPLVKYIRNQRTQQKPENSAPEKPASPTFKAADQTVTTKSIPPGKLSDPEVEKKTDNVIEEYWLKRQELADSGDVY